MKRPDPEKLMTYDDVVDEIELPHGLSTVFRVEERHGKGWFDVTIDDEGFVRTLGTERAYVKKSDRVIGL